MKKKKRDAIRDEGYWEGWSDGQNVLKGDLMKTLNLIKGHCDDETKQDLCGHKNYQILARVDDSSVGAVGTDLPLSWSPICRDCGADVPAAPK